MIWKYHELDPDRRETASKTTVKWPNQHARGPAPKQLVFSGFLVIYITADLGRGANGAARCQTGTSVKIVGKSSRNIPASAQCPQGRPYKWPTLSFEVAFLVVTPLPAEGPLDFGSPPKPCGLFSIVQAVFCPSPP